MNLLRTTLASSIVLLVVLPVLPGCGIIDKLRGKGVDAGVDAAVDTTDSAAPLAVADPDAGAADAADASTTATLTVSPPIVGACKSGDLADCTAKCTVQKNQSSCVNLGIMFDTGNGVAVDTGKAATLFQGACDAKVGAGCEHFGIALHTGRGIVADRPRAATVFSKGCDLKNADSCNQQALMEVRGDGVPKDTVKAVDLFKKSCDLGDAFGCGNLANHLASGDGIARDPVRAAALRKTACDKGDQQACSALAASSGGTVADAGAVATTANSANPTAADCVVMKKTFMDTCVSGCADKLAAKNFKKTDAERRTFCEGGCATQMFTTPTMAKCKGK